MYRNLWRSWSALCGNALGEPRDCRACRYRSPDVDDDDESAADGKEKNMWDGADRDGCERHLVHAEMIFGMAREMNREMIELFGKKCSRLSLKHTWRREYGVCGRVRSEMRLDETDGNSEDDVGIAMREGPASRTSDLKNSVD